MPIIWAIIRQRPVGLHITQRPQRGHDGRSADQAEFLQEHGRVMRIKNKNIKNSFDIKVGRGEAFSLVQILVRFRLGNRLLFPVRRDEKASFLIS